MIASLIIAGHGFYNLIRHGSCDPDNPENCPFGQPKCSEAAHCKPCVCDGEEISCSSPAFDACGGKEECDCKEVCKEAKNMEEKEGVEHPPEKNDQRPTTNDQ
jgi:hypothetical protein